MNQNMETSAVIGVVSGRVQGVFFRASLAKEANRLGLRGYVRNLTDGRVEFVAIGEKPKVTELIAWSHTGPVLARVSGVDLQDFSGEDTFTGFSVAR